MKKKYIDEQGVCPFCHKSNLAYGTAEFEDDMLMFPWECNNCGKTGEEWYDLKFIGHDVFIEIDNKYEKYEVSALIKKEKENDLKVKFNNGTISFEKYTHLMNELSKSKRKTREAYMKNAR